MVDATAGKETLSDIAGDGVQIGTAALENILTISMRKYIIWLNYSTFWNLSHRSIRTRANDTGIGLSIAACL